MPFTHTSTAQRKRVALMLAVSVGFFVAVLISAFSAVRLMMQYGLFFISGILLMGIWLRSRKLITLTPDTCSFDPEGIAWQHGGEGERLEWKKVLRCMIITGKGVSIRLKTNDGSTRQIPSDCLPGETEELLEILKKEVMPRGSWITFSLDNEILQERRKE